MTKELTFDRPLYKSELAEAFGLTWRTIEKRLKKAGLVVDRTARLLSAGVARQVAAVLAD
jgi:DNA-binding transcriptional ArsR family regulator